MAYSGWYEDNWFEVNLEKEGISCSKEQMRMAAEGHITTEALMWNQNNQKTISGMVKLFSLYSYMHSKILKEKITLLRNFLVNLFSFFPPPLNINQNETPRMLNPGHVQFT